MITRSFLYKVLHFSTGEMLIKLLAEQFVHLLLFILWINALAVLEEKPIISSCLTRIMGFILDWV